ncbi:MAG: calcium-binding protein, partial [Pseudomonadota bacterium]
MTDTNFVATHELVEVSNPLNQDREFVSLAAEPGGGYVMSWTSAFDSVNNTDEIYAQRFNADGTEFGAAFQVNSTIAGNQTQSQVAVLNNGDIVVTWQSANQDGDENGIYMQRFNSAGVPLGTETLVNTTTTGNQYDAEVIALSGGDFAVIWADEDDPGNVASIRMQRYNSDGTTNGSELVLHSENLPATVFQDIEVVELTGGRLAISWDRTSFSGQANDTAQLAIYTQAGVQISAPVNPEQTADQVLTDPATGIVALGNGNVLITWVASFNMTGSNNVGYSDIMGRIYDQNGVAQTSEFAITAGVDNRRFAIFAESDGNGGALIGYIEEGATVFYKPLEIVHLDQNGNIIAEAIWASPNENRGTDFATMVILSNGDVIVAYQDELGGGDIHHHRLVDATDVRFDDTANTVTLLDTGEAVTGLEGDDNITGGSGDDLIGGGKGIDTIDGGGGDDTIQGNEDDDILSGGDGEDTIVGGSGNDTINGDDHADLLDGMTGNDTINGGDGVDRIYGGAGSDTINGGEGDDFLFGFREGPGGPFIAPGEDTDIGFTNIINGDGGHDRIDGGRGDDIINGGEGDDILNGDVLGTVLGVLVGGNDLFIASNGADSSFGGLGFDTIDYSGMNGALTVVFRANPASTFDFRGTVLIDANGGNPQYAQFINEIERLIATNLADTITGFIEDETIEGRGGDDRIGGGGGNDILDGGDDTDTAVFRNAISNYDFDVEGVTLNVTDSFAGGTNDGVDMLDNFEQLEFDGVLYTLQRGTTTAQTLIGGSMNDHFVGDDGADYLLDTAGGDDVLFGGEGNDQLQGSAGADQN